MSEAVRELDDVTFHDLYAAYPELDIDVPGEQALLKRHDRVVFQHPLYWYSTPAILKEWQDLVLQHGWAYGSEGTALQGKRLVSAITAGGSEDSYRPDGSNRFTIRELLRPIEQTARLCGMHYDGVYAIHGTLGLSAEKIREEAVAYRRFIEAYRDDRLDLAAAQAAPRLNADLEGLIHDVR